MDTIRAMLEEHKFIVICRDVYGDTLLEAMEALYKGGVRLAEVTFGQKSGGYKEALDAITMLEGYFRDRMAIGAGTVVSPAQVELAYQAKATYIISPNVNEAVIRKTKELSILSIPGALSPSEILDIHEYGADYIKLSPAARITTSYIKDLIGPIFHVKFITTAGITEEDIIELAAIGCTGYGTSRRLMDKRVIREGHFEKLQHRVGAFIARLQKEEE